MIMSVVTDFAALNYRTVSN
uniref:Uncharacterized protein n=1 Tax=Anguilla anguilla TaxID=7936 RepID=A0A0E9XTX3_ANGAN